MTTTEGHVSPATTPEAVAVAAAVTATVKRSPNRYIELDVKAVVTRAGDNIRSGELPDIEGLAASIKAEGVIEPLLVTPAMGTDGKPLEGKYTVVAGHRRLAAVRSLGGGTVPALVVDADVDRRLKLALIENLQREDMNPLDKAKAIVKLLKNTKLEQQEVAQALGVTPAFVSQYATILELPESALSALRDGEISFTQARVLCKLLPNTKAIDDLVFDASNMTVAQLDSKVSHMVAQAKEAAAEAEEAAEEDSDEAKPKKKKKAAPSEKEIEYYTEADFHPLKKEDIRDLMIQYKQKEIRAENAKKREEYRLILKGITLAADLRLK